MPRIVTRLLLGLIAGLLSSIVTCLVAYLIGVVVILIQSGELFPTLLAALTVLPMMLLLVLLPLTLFIGGATGLLLTFFSSAPIRSYIVGLGALAGSILAVLILGVIAPALFKSESGDFVNVIRNPILAAGYGVLLGALTGMFYRHLATR